MFRRAAEKAAVAFTKGDKFVAEGYIHAYTMSDPDGQMFEREEFVARKIGHDNAVTNYTVNRPARQAAQAPGVPMIQQGPTNGVAPVPPAPPQPVAVGMCSSLRSSTDSIGSPTGASSIGFHLNRL